MPLFSILLRLACAALLACASAAWAQPPLKLSIVGGLASGNQFAQQEQPFWTQELPRLSGGRYQADIVPFDRAGVPGPEMLRLMQLGVVPFGTVLMASLPAQYPQYTVADLPGLNADVGQLRANVAALRPYLEKSLREQHGIQLLALYAYPPQVVFCKQPLARLADLAGRRIRVSSAAQADFVEALKAEPVLIEFGKTVRGIEAGRIECALTGAMSGYTLGLDSVTQYLYPLSVNWGLALFGANLAAWNGLPPDLRALLRRELPKLESAIWADAERYAAEGLACASGGAGCHLPRKGPPGRMTVVPVSPQDGQLRSQIFETVVLRRWLQRCTVDCVALWNQTIGAARGVLLPASAASAK
ncbi:MAG: TRAP transporter substrate-binding protein [Acidovorax sp.]